MRDRQRALLPGDQIKGDVAMTSHGPTSANKRTTSARVSRSRLRSALMPQGLTSNKREPARSNRFTRACGGQLDHYVYTRAIYRRMQNQRAGSRLLGLEEGLMSSKSRCRECGRHMTWAAQRVQYGRMMRRGFTQDVARRTLPRCQKCMTQWLRAMGAPSNTPGGHPTSVRHDHLGQKTIESPERTDLRSR